MEVQFSNEEKTKFDKCASMEEFAAFLENCTINGMDNYGNSILHYYMKSLMYKSNRDRYKNKQSFKLDPQAIIKAMVEKGHDLNLQATKGAKKNTALGLSIGLGYQSKEVFDLLISLGADINIPVKQGNSLLFEAVMVYKYDEETNGYIIKKLLELGADQNAENKQGLSGLSMATKTSNKAILSLFEAAE